VYQKRYHAVVSGRVQGVGYRYFTRDTALELNLSGWVRNMPDGRVELEVQGVQDLVDEFFLDLRNGPPLSRVTDLNIRELPPHEDGGEFIIRR